MHLDHIGIATSDPEKTRWFFREVLGLSSGGQENVPSQAVAVEFFPLATGSTRLEILESTHNDGPIAKYLQKRGGGIHHLALRVKDLPTTIKRMEQHNVRLLPTTPGAEGTTVVFIHPASTGGVLVELVGSNE